MEKDQTIQKLRESRVQTSSPNQPDPKPEAPSQVAVPAETKTEKVQKYSSMLKTLNSYKSQYNKAQSSDQKEKIHSEIENFTKNWLDAKNVQVGSELETSPSSERYLMTWDDTTDAIQ